MMCGRRFAPLGAVCLMVCIAVLGCGGTNAPADASTLDDAAVDATVEVPIDGGLVDECLAANGGCSADATCTDLAVGRTCACLPGFGGDGLTCMPRMLGVSAVEAYIKASNTGQGDAFGYTVALSGDGNTLVVAAVLEAGSGTGVSPAANERAMESGAVYVYTRTASTWVFQAYIKASNTGAGDHFGGSLALSADGSTLAVGATEEDGSGTGVNPPDDNGIGDSGAVYVYVREGSTWSFQAYLKASHSGPSDDFGNSVALSADGNTLAVGANQEDGSGTGINPENVQSAELSGAVFVFTRVASTWGFQAYVKAINTESGQGFGYAIALSADGNTLAIGAPGEDGSGRGVNPPLDEDTAEAGAVYVYTRVADVWSFQAYLKAGNSASSDQFGYAVALSADGNTLAVGAPLEDGGGTSVGPAFDDRAPDSGAVYLYTRDASTWHPGDYVKASNTGAQDSFGSHVALSGDGATLAVGAAQEDGLGMGVNPANIEGGYEIGAAYTYTRLAEAWSFQAYVKARNTDGDDYFGGAIALNATGSTLAVGASRESGSGRGVNPAIDDSQPYSGAVYVYR